MTTGSLNGWTSTRPVCSELLESRERGRRAPGLEVDRGAVPTCGGDLRAARPCPHDEERVDSLGGCGPCECLGVVAGRHADHAALPLLDRERAHPVERTSRLERACALEQLRLQMLPGPEAAGAEGRCAVCRTPDRRCRAGDVVGCDSRVRHRVIVVDRRSSENARDGRRRPLPIRIVVTDDLERSRMTVFFRLLLAIPHLFVVLLWGIAAFAVARPLDCARRRGEGAAHPAGVRGVVRSVRHAGERVPLPRGSAVSRRSAEPLGIRSTSRSISPPRQSRGRVAARLVLALPAFILIAVLGGGISGGSSASITSTTSGSDDWWLNTWSVGGVSTTVAFSRGSRPWLAAGCRSASRPARVLHRLHRPRHRATSSSSPTATRPPTRPVSFPSSSCRLTGAARAHGRCPPITPDGVLPLSSRRATSHLADSLGTPVVLLMAPAWLIMLVIGRLPAPLHRFFTAWIRYTTM